MKAAVYRGANDVRLEELPVPAIGPGELLLRVEACGVCGTDLKKIAQGEMLPPRIFGHEVAGRVASVGPGVLDWKPGDRAAFFHHIPCRRCDLCREQSFAQCPQYLRVGTTAGFEPAGGGFSEFVRIMDWIVQDGLVRIPEGIESEEAAFVEPVNTCLKGIRRAGLSPGKSVLLFGSGPIGLILLQLARLEKATVFVTDPIPERLAMARRLGAEVVPPPRAVDVALVATSSHEAIRAALHAVRPAGRVVLFAQTHVGEEVAVDVGQIGKLEKQLIGSYSASVELQEESARLVFEKAIQVKPLITHRFELERIREAIDVANRPSAESLKVFVQPNGVRFP